jgi:hypothetical protein
MKRGLRQIEWAFDMSCEGQTYPGYTDDSHWNGFLNVVISPETRAKVVADLRAEGSNDSADIILNLPTNKAGMIWLADGWSIQEIT